MLICALWPQGVGYTTLRSQTPPDSSDFPIAQARQFALDQIGRYSADPALAAAFWAEINGPPPKSDITVCYCFLRVGAASYSLLEFVSGQTLEQLCQAADPSSCERIIPLISRLLDACEHLTAKGARSRRWPRFRGPGTGGGAIRISDFGVARASVASAPGKLYGTVLIGPGGSWCEEILSEAAGRSSAYPLLMAVYQKLLDGLPSTTALIPAQLDGFSKRSLCPGKLDEMVRRRALPALISIGAAALLLASLAWLGQLVSSKAPQPVAPAPPGIVKLQLTIHPDGSVQVAKVLSGDPSLAGAAVEKIHQLVYKPAEINGKPTSATIDMEIKLDSR